MDATLHVDIYCHCLPPRFPFGNVGEDDLVRREAMNFTVGVLVCFGLKFCSESKAISYRTRRQGPRGHPAFFTYGHRIPFLLCLYPQAAPGH